MQIAVLSDIHSNHAALRRCVEYAQERGIDKFVFLGDYLGELAYPRKTMEFLYELKAKCSCFFIKGNKEGYWIDYEKGGEQGWKEIDSTTGALFYTYHQLTAEDMAFFKSLSYTAELDFGGGLPALTICHGSPRRVNEELRLGEMQTYEVMENDPNSIILCGHTHLQGMIEHGRKMVLNPGAVGCPKGVGGKTQFLILKAVDSVWQHEFVNLEYDVEQAVTELYESGLVQKAPGLCKTMEHLLRTGENSVMTVLARAMELCREETGTCIWPQIPEKYWEQAVEECLN